MIDYLTAIIRPLIQYPESLVVTESQDPMGVLLTVDLHAEDMGRVIGKSGTTAQGIRTLLRAYGATHGARISLKINEPAGRTTARPLKNIDEAIDTL